MRKRITTSAILALTLIVVVLSGCKPTEAGYREAYQRAVANAKDKDREGLTDEEYMLIQKENAPKYRRIGQDSVAYLHKALTPEPANIEVNPLRHFNLAVGKFRMPTNARSLSNRLKERGFSSYIGKDADSDYFVIVGGSATDNDIPGLMHRFEKSGIECAGMDFPLLIIIDALSGPDNSRQERPVGKVSPK